MNALRRWFRIHLSTAIVLMFVAGGLMWLNNIPGMLKPISISKFPGSNLGYTIEELPTIGWPFTIYEDSGWRRANALATEFTHRYDLTFSSVKYWANLSVAALIFFVTAVLLERRIRRKQPLSKPEPQ